jgi:hypothetical protein
MPSLRLVAAIQTSQPRAIPRTLAGSQCLKNEVRTNSLRPWQGRKDCILQNNSLIFGHFSLEMWSRAACDWELWGKLTHSTLASTVDGYHFT